MLVLPLSVPLHAHVPTIAVLPGTAAAWCTADETADETALTVDEVEA